MDLSEHAQELRTIAIFERAEQLRIDDPTLSETQAEITAAVQIDAEDARAPGFSPEDFR